MQELRFIGAHEMRIEGYLLTRLIQDDVLITNHGIHHLHSAKVPADCGAPKTQSPSTLSLSRTSTRGKYGGT